MPSEILNLDSIDDARRKSIQSTIHEISIEELKSLGEGLFPYHDHPWRETFFGFIAENTGATFYHATTHDRYHVLYCRDKERGMWFLPGSGMGPLQEKGLKAMKELSKNV